MSILKMSLAAARVNAGLSQREAAKLLGITPGTLRNYEQGKQVPSWTTVKEMERIYGISAENMIIGSKKDAEPAR